MNISRPARAGSTWLSWLRSEIVRTSAMGCGERVRTMVVRFGSGLPMDSKVLRPMTMTWHQARLRPHDMHRAALAPVRTCLAPEHLGEKGMQRDSLCDLVVQPA